MNGLAADRFHALDKENSSEATTRNFVRDIAFGIFHPDRSELRGEIGVAEIATLQFGLEEPLYLSLPILPFRRHGESLNSMLKSS